MIVKTLTPEIRAAATDMRKTALARLQDKEWRSLELTPSEITSFVKLLEATGVAYEVVNQVARDLRLYNTWDSIAMWMDVDFGLVCFAPDEMLALAREITRALERRYHNEA